jgi:hypothetical protein
MSHQSSVRQRLESDFHAEPFPQEHSGLESCPRIGNRAIDLAIALEVLFMNADRDEHSYRISLRISRFLRMRGADRLKAFAEVRKLYDIRSKMVHTGSVPNDWNINGTERITVDIVETVDALCTEAIRKFVVAGHIPDDWRPIELSKGLSRNKPLIYKTSKLRRRS